MTNRTTNNLRSLIPFLMALAIIISAATPVSAAYDNTSGSNVWFSHSGAICRMNAKSGKVKKLYTLADTAANPVQDLICWGDYLYFCLDGRTIPNNSDLKGRWICRINKDGTGFSALDAGFCPQIYKGSLYYISSEYDTETGEESVLGISRMGMAGGSNEVLLVSSAVKRIALLKGVIYYLTDSGSYYEYVRSYHLSTKKRYIIYKDVDGFMDISISDGSTVYVTTARRGMLRYYPRQKMTRKYLPTADGYELHGVQGGWIYYSSGRTLLRMNAATGKKSRIRTLKSGEPTGLIYGGNQWLIITQDIVSGRYNRAIVRMRVNGKNAKTLARWYEK